MRNKVSIKQKVFEKLHIPELRNIGTDRINMWKLHQRQQEFLPCIYVKPIHLISDPYPSSWGAKEGKAQNLNLIFPKLLKEIWRVFKCLWITCYIFFGIFAQLKPIEN